MDMDSVVLVLFLVMRIVMAVGCVLFLIVAWRLMRAHESLSRSAKELADNIKQRQLIT